MTTTHTFCCLTTKKNERGDPIDSFDFVCYVEMEKKEGGLFV